MAASRVVGSYPCEIVIREVRLDLTDEPPLASVVLALNVPGIDPVVLGSGPMPISADVPRELTEPLLAYLQEYVGRVHADSAGEAEPPQPAMPAAQPAGDQGFRIED